MIDFDAQTMGEIAPAFSGANTQRQNAIIIAGGKVLAKALQSFSTDVRLRIAHLLAQTCHESAGFRTTEEFASRRAHENRKDLDNDKAGDGPRYKGRGLLQLTSRANDRDPGKTLEPELEEYPELAAEPMLSLTIACEFRKKEAHQRRMRCRRFRAGDEADRQRHERAGRPPGIDFYGEDSHRTAGGVCAHRRSPPTKDRPVLRRGSKCDAVGRLQRLPRSQGFMIAVDSHFGDGTEMAVAALQKQQGCVAMDGIVGNDTWTALDPSGEPRQPAASVVGSRKRCGNVRGSTLWPQRRACA
jgi:putative chitinase